MYAFLSVLGAVIAAAGLALLASGISINTHAFDSTNVTPATIAVIGGCILIGLAFVVRALLRVEHALMSRPMPRPVHAGGTADSAAVATQPSEAARIPFPAKPKTAPAVAAPPPIPVAVPGAASVEAVPSEAARPSIPQGAENPPVVEETDVSLLPKAPIRAEEAAVEAKPKPAVAVRTNGAGPAKTSSAQAALSGRPAPQQQAKSSIFDALWPKTQHAAAAINTRAPRPHPAAVSAPATVSQPAAVSAPATVSQPAAAGVQSAQPPAAPAVAVSHETTAAVSILKSGVVEGMAYTLYSDGSIEAQLPGGTLRFGSITELRNHIEQNG